ncbi:MAG: DUF418 domain-containing protein [Phycisphaerae bacterium]
MNSHDPNEPIAARPVAGFEPQPLAPQSQRVDVMDALRGFALLGIFLVNMPYHNGSFYSTQTPTMQWPSSIDHAAEFLVRALAESKFYTMFSLLFGMGLALQRERVLSRGGGFVGLYARRLLVLLGFGVCHIAFVWVGDILLTYALLGFLLILFSRRADKTLLAWFLSLAVLYPLVMAGMMSLPVIGELLPDGGAKFASEIAKGVEEARVEAERAIQNYSTGDYVSVMRQRLHDWTSVGFYMVVMAPSIFSMFLLGVVAGRRGWLRTPEAHKKLWRDLLLIALPIGLVLSIAAAYLLHDQNLARPTGRSAAGMGLSAAGAPLLCMGYVAIFVSVWQRLRGGMLRPLVATGRMALTNYLMQSIVCALIFHGYGLGWYGKTSPATGVLIVFVVYATQIALSNWWLARYRFGPAEWLWRTLTYGRMQPMRGPASGE